MRKKCNIDVEEINKNYHLLEGIPSSRQKKKLEKIKQDIYEKYSPERIKCIGRKNSK